MAALSSPNQKLCKICKFRLKKLSCGHFNCRNCLQILMDFKDQLVGVQSSDWCPRCDTDDPDELARLFKATKTDSILKDLKQKRKELKMAAEQRERIIETVVRIRCAVESALRRKELEVMETLDEAYEQLQTLTSENINRFEERLDSIQNCSKILPKTSTVKPRESGDLNDLTLGALPSPVQEPVSEFYGLKFDPDERFFQTLKKLMSIPLGRASLILKNPDDEKHSDSGLSLSHQFDFSFNSTLESQPQDHPEDHPEDQAQDFQNDLDRYSTKSINSSEYNNLFFQTKENKQKSPFFTHDLNDPVLERTNNSPTPSSPLTCDSGLSSVFSFSCQDNFLETSGRKIISKPDSPESPVSTKKWMRYPSTKIRNFLQILRKPNSQKKRHLAKKTKIAFTQSHSVDSTVGSGYQGSQSHSVDSTVGSAVLGSQSHSVDSTVGSGYQGSQSHSVDSTVGSGYQGSQSHSVDSTLRSGVLGSQSNSVDSTLGSGFLETLSHSVDSSLGSGFLETLSHSVNSTLGSGFLASRSDSFTQPPKAKTSCSSETTKHRQDNQSSCQRSNSFPAFNFQQDVHTTSGVTDPPIKLVEFSALTENEHCCWLIDVVFLSDEKYVAVFDAFNRNVKKFETMTGKLSSELRLNSEKSNLAVLSDSCLVVTLPESNELGFIDYTGCMKMERKGRTSKAYTGIASLATDRVICASNSFDSSIDILSLHCDVLVSFSRKNLFWEIPFFPTYLHSTRDGSKVYISDRIQRCLICLNVIDGCIDFSYYGTEGCAVTWPAGVACGPQGSIYLADCFKTRIHRLSPTGQYDCCLGLDKGSMKMCRAMDISSKGELVLTEYHRKSIKIFKL